MSTLTPSEPLPIRQPEGHGGSRKDTKAHDVHLATSGFPS